MQRQFTVRLPEDPGEALDAATERLNRKRSDIVRLALREYLGTFDRSTRQSDRVQSLIGSLESGVRPDLAEQHRAYIVEALRRGR